MNNDKPDTAPATEAKPMTKADLEWERERFRWWMDGPERRAKREGWAPDEFDDCC